MGGNYCLTQEQIDSFGHGHAPYSSDFQEWDHVVFTHSGRSAITTAVRHLGLEGHEVLVPNFSCHSISDAFFSCDCKVNYYPIQREGLSVNVDELLRLIEGHRPAILYTCPLFGFDTLHSLRNHYNDIKAQGVCIIEDATHSLFSGFASKEADVVVCSLRKWLEIPDGGFIWGLNGFDIDGFYTTHQERTDIVKNFISASKLKLAYLRTGNDELKKEFLPLFYKNNDLFDETSISCRMSSFSHDILQQADFSRIVERRRANYNYLLNHIDNPLVEIIFTSLPTGVAPLYLQIYVHNGLRDQMQQELVKERLYCPVVWPTPEHIKHECPAEDLAFHNDILSLVIDQRYDTADMERFVRVINEFRQ